MAMIVIKTERVKSIIETILNDNKTLLEMQKEFISIAVYSYFQQKQN